MFNRIVLSLLAFIMLQTAASAFDGFRTTLDCSYQEKSAFFSENIQFGLNEQMQSLDVIYVYPTIPGTQIDAVTEMEPGSLYVNIQHIRSDGSHAQGDYHEINIENGEILSGLIGAPISEAVGTCRVTIEKPSPSEGCAFFGAESDLVRGGAFCANQQLADYKDISYGAGNLWTDGAWCTSLNEPQQRRLAFLTLGTISLVVRPRLHD